MSRKHFKPYRIVGAYDSETTNVNQDGVHTAFPVLHQLGILNGISIENVTPENVEQCTDIRLYRHAIELYSVLDELLNVYTDCVPVILCHNLSFDMYGLSQWLNYHEIKVLAKSARKPISFTVIDSGEPQLVIWDTAIFTQKSLEYMGNVCGYTKLVGSWDYNKIRTPQTELTSDEIAYAQHDVYALLAYMGYWCRLNPDINSQDLALKVVTKTGVVRNRRLSRFENVKGLGLSKTVGQYWHMLNEQNRFKTNDELFTCIASTRGGFTFVSSANASRAFEYRESEPYRIVGFDATSQHPAQIVSHRYPVKFRHATPEKLQTAFEIVSLKTPAQVLKRYDKPFPVAFYGCFEFENLRPKPSTVFANCGIYPLASARCKEHAIDSRLLDDNQQSEEFRHFIAEQGYKDIAENAACEFGKLVSADKCVLFLTELAAWEVSQVYCYDKVTAIDGYITMQFDKPSDMLVLSVMNFYAAKNEFKRARGHYYSNEPIRNSEKLVQLGIPEYVVEGMQAHTIDDETVEQVYLGLKADLNSLFGIEACNEYRRETVLTDSGIAYVGNYGIECAPKLSKAFYQCGQRIVGWSRIAQVLVMELIAPHVQTIVNGDTDSIKAVAHIADLQKVNADLQVFSDAIDRAKAKVCARARVSYPDYYDSLESIGYYVQEFETCKYGASWNKAYAICETDKRDGKEHVKFTLAGIPAGRGANQLATRFLDSGMSFGAVLDLFLGYNVTYSYKLIGLHARAIPQWGETVIATVTDYKGDTYKVVEPAALCLYPMAKTVNDTGNADNAANMSIALRNRPTVNIEPVILTSAGAIKTGDLLG